MQFSVCLWSTISRGLGFSGWAVLALSLLLRLTLSMGTQPEPSSSPHGLHTVLAAGPAGTGEGQATHSIPPPVGSQKHIWTGIWEALLSLDPAVASPPLWVSCNQQMCLRGAMVGSSGLPWAALLTRQGDIVFKVCPGAALQHRTNSCNKVLACCL